MKFSLNRIAVISLLMLGSLSANAAIITGGLSYDDTGTHLITGTNDLTYVGWGETASYNYAQTVAATQAGGLYEDYHIANQSEAREFFTLATGAAAPTGNGELFANADNFHFRFGNNYIEEPVAAALFLADLSDSGEDAGLLLSRDGTILMKNSWLSIGETDYYSELGEGPWDKHITWLLVSDKASVPGPATSLILGLGLLGLGFARKQKIG
ncbi:hypothetical protein [Psychromonas aquimarina]|uniref:hypothetical protein n=1 Tax=Psychromonas aquimarina TaxID=444919 RepID=UPI00040C03DA|nr:hypothetical protein [Psychromonas aquimarina]